MEKIRTPPPIIAPSGCFSGSSDPECYTENQRNWCKISRNHPKCVSEEIQFPDCKDGSVDKRCKEVVLPQSQCFEGSTDPNCIRIEKQITPCFVGSNLPHCVAEEITIFTCLPGSNDPRCIPSVPILPDCQPGSLDSRCLPTFSLPLDCSIDPQNPSCNQVNEVLDCVFFPTHPLCSTATTEICYPGSIHPACPLPISQEITHKPEKKCRPNSNDPACLPVTIFKIPGININVPNTPLEILCPFGSIDPICNMPPQTLKCILRPDDPNCSSIMTTQPSTNTLKCEIGSLDPRCTQAHRESTFQTKPTSKPSTPITTTPFEEIPVPILCDRGSDDPNCPQIVQISVDEFFCGPNSDNPDCPEYTRVPEVPIPEIISVPNLEEINHCLPGSDDPMCISQEIPYVPIIQEAKLTNFICSEGSQDPKCNPLSVEFIDCVKNPFDVQCSDIIVDEPPSSIPRPITPESPLSCALTPNHPSCRQSSTHCNPRSTDPSCREIVKKRDPPPKSHKIEFCLLNPNNQRCVKKNVPKLDCEENSNDSRCRPAKVKPTIPTVVESEEKIIAVNCVSNPSHPECLRIPSGPSKSKCFFGSNDPQCIEPPLIECIFGSKKPPCDIGSKEKKTTFPVKEDSRTTPVTIQTTVTPKIPKIFRTTTPQFNVQIPVSTETPQEVPQFPPPFVLPPKIQEPKKRLEILKKESLPEKPVKPYISIEIPVFPSRFSSPRIPISDVSEEFISKTTEKSKLPITFTPQFPPTVPTPPSRAQSKTKQPTTRTYRITTPKPRTTSPKIISEEELEFPPLPSSIPSKLPTRPNIPTVPIRKVTEPFSPTVPPVDSFIPTVPAKLKVTTDIYEEPRREVNEKQIDVPNLSIEIKNSREPNIETSRPIIATVTPIRTKVTSTIRTPSRVTRPISKQVRFTTDTSVAKPTRRKPDFTRPVDKFKQSREKITPSYPPEIPQTISTKSPTTSQRQPNLERGESKVSTVRPVVSLEDRKKEPRPVKKMHGKDDHHGEGADPRYHAFHSCKYRND